MRYAYGCLACYKSERYCGDCLGKGDRTTVVELASDESAPFDFNSDVAERVVIRSHAREAELAGAAAVEIPDGATVTVYKPLGESDLVKATRALETASAKYKAVSAEYWPAHEAYHAAKQRLKLAMEAL